MSKYKYFKDRNKSLEDVGLKRELIRKGYNRTINFSSNDYLGLAMHPDVMAKTKDILAQFGVGGTSSRLLAGTFSIHQKLEEELASFLNKESALVFSSGYHANTGILPALAQSGDLILIDRLAHASLIDGVRLSHARFFSYDHNNVDHLESLLRKKRNNYRNVYIVTEGIFSMDGDYGIIPEIVYLAKKWDAFVYLDEAHSFGIEGPGGRGRAAQLDLLKDIDFFVGTLSKTIGSQGGFICCAEVIKDLLVSTCRSFLYTTALSPVCVGAALAALRLLPSLEADRDHLRNEAKRVRMDLVQNHFSIGKSETQIIPIITGGVKETKKLSDDLLSAGYFVPSIRPPTVPEGQGRVRLSITKDVCGEATTTLLDAIKGEKIVQVQ